MEDRRRVVDMNDMCFDSEFFDLFGTKAAPRAALLYQRLWGLAEDWGGYEPKYTDIALKMGVFGFTAKEVAGYIEKLVAAKKIVEFRAGDRVLHWIRNFLRRQPLNNPKVATLPLPEWIVCEIKTKGKTKRKYAVYSIAYDKLPEDVKPLMCTVHDQYMSSTCPVHDQSVKGIKDVDLDLDVDLKRKKKDGKRGAGPETTVTDQTGQDPDQKRPDPKRPENSGPETAGPELPPATAPVREGVGRDAPYWQEVPNWVVSDMERLKSFCLNRHIVLTDAQVLHIGKMKPDSRRAAVMALFNEAMDVAREKRVEPG